MAACARVVYTSGSLHWGRKLRGNHVTEESFPLFFALDTVQLSSQVYKMFLYPGIQHF